MIDTAWWERQDARRFLAFNWSHPSRTFATDTALALAMAHGGALIEVGPGSGVDYARGFRDAVTTGNLRYVGCEPTQAFHAALVAQYPEAEWVQASCYDMTHRAPVVYARAVLEHQPALRPALDLLLAAAERCVVLDWYRPPEEVPSCDWVEGVPCHTFARAEVRRVLDAHGARVTVRQRIEGNEVWVVEVA